MLNLACKILFLKNNEINWVNDPKKQLPRQHPVNNQTPSKSINIQKVVNSNLKQSLSVWVKFHLFSHSSISHSNTVLYRLMSTETLFPSPYASKKKKYIEGKFFIHKKKISPWVLQFENLKAICILIWEIASCCKYENDIVQ